MYVQELHVPTISRPYNGYCFTICSDFSLNSLSCFTIVIVYCICYAQNKTMYKNTIESMLNQC